MGRTRDLFKEIREITGSSNARCGVMKGSLVKVVTEDKEVKEIWQTYTEVALLYRRDPNVKSIFVETGYEDEPEVLELEGKDALRHISTRKVAGGDDIPIELLKGGESVDHYVQLCMEEGGMAVRLEKVSVYPDLQERRQGGMWKLPHNCLDLARK